MPKAVRRSGQRPSAKKVDTEELDLLARELFEADDELALETSDETLEETDREVEETQFKIVQEKNDFFVRQIAGFINQQSWLNVRPEYQRRRRWDVKKKSRLIESLLLNVPIPPIFLYEARIGRFEVMDGQQRVNAVIEFLNNDFKLAGLSVWSNLNGSDFSECSNSIKRVLLRRKISAVALTADAVWSKKLRKLDLRRIVFERLNTGGEKLNPQELRNCLYGGNLNRKIVELARTDLFTKIWGIPPAVSDEDREEASPERLGHTLYRTMGDCQIVLRFFAFRRTGQIKGSVRGALDRFMEDNMSLREQEVERLGERFSINLKAANRIFGDATFRLPPDDKNRRRLSVPLYDAVMVALDHLHEEHQNLIRRSIQVQNSLDSRLSHARNRELVVGRPNSAEAIRQRIKLVREALKAALD